MHFEPLAKPYVELGRYRHYKGNTYQVFGIVRHSQTEEWLVLYGDLGPSWVRPYNSFVEQVEINSELVPRFQLVARVEVVEETQ